MRACVALWMCLLLSAAAAPASAQDKPRPAAASKRQHKPKPSSAEAKSEPKRKPRARPRAARAAQPTAAASTHETPPPSAAGETPRHPDAHPEPKAPSGSANALSEADAEENVHKEGGTEVKTVEFGGLDIEGQLKTPQMLYFLNRLRAEFDRPQLPHRSFIPELQRSTKENAF